MTKHKTCQESDTMRWLQTNIFFFAISQHADKVNQLSKSKFYQLKSDIQSLVNILCCRFRCFIAASATVITHNAASLLVVQGQTGHRHTVLWIAHRTAQAYGVSAIALEFLSYTPVLRLPLLITDCCLVSQRPLFPQCARWCMWVNLFFGQREALWWSGNRNSLQ